MEGRAGETAFKRRRVYSLGLDLCVMRQRKMDLVAEPMMVQVPF